MDSYLTIIAQYEGGIKLIENPLEDIEIKTKIKVNIENRGKVINCSQQVP